MLRLYDNAFSPFARKVRIALELKGLAHDVVDGLALENRALLEAVNGRVEVPAIDHDGLVVVGSADIVAYLERAFPGAPPLHPEGHAEWVHARAWERCADTVVDPILIDISYWIWAERDDAMPDGMLDAARRDMDRIYAALERDLEGRPFLGGACPSIADVALFPHVTATRMLQVPYDAARFPRVHAWMQRLRAHPAFAADLARVKTFLTTFASASTHERRKIFWRGDRLEWLLARGYHGWLVREIEEDRVLWPGLGIPGPRA
jgi:glutathione S-transferase